MRLRSIHLFMGIVTVLVFLGTGLYMRLNFPLLYRENEVIRYLFRANHVYLLFSGLMNVLLGLHLSSSAGKNWKNYLSRAGSWLLIASPFLFLLAFVVEPPQASPYRPITLVAVFMVFFSIVAHTVAGYRVDKETPEDRR